MPQTNQTTTEPIPEKKKKNPYLASVGKFAKEPLWDALQEEIQKFRKERNESIDNEAPPVDKAA
jgi:hypothetical protein